MLTRNNGLDCLFYFLFICLFLNTERDGGEIIFVETYNSLIVQSYLILCAISLFLMDCNKINTYKCSKISIFLFKCKLRHYINSSMCASQKQKYILFMLFIA